MRIYGVDFTSAPRMRKPITCAECTLDSDLLRVDRFEALYTFEDFEGLLRRPGPWVAGLDFPFGQPRRLIEGLGWPQTWAGYVGFVAMMDQAVFEATLATYRQGRAVGDKQHRRVTDVLADARSPMMLYGVPVGKMFFQGAPRLLRSDVSVQPCSLTDDSRIVIEAYPALLARRWSEGGYKSDTKRKQIPAQQAARSAIVKGLRSDGLRSIYGFGIELAQELADDFIADGSGDQLDAFLCAIQAAWSAIQPDQSYGIPANCDRLEGWIVDPGQLGHHGPALPTD